MTRIPTLLISTMIKIDANRKRPNKNGCLSVRPDVIKAVNRIYGRRFEADDAMARAPSVEMLRLYLGHFATRARLKRRPTMEDMVRIWRGGPNGHRAPSTVPYWRRVEAVIQDYLNHLTEPPRI